MSIIKKIIAIALFCLCCLSPVFAFQHIAIQSPSQGDSFYVGDTIHFRYTGDATVGDGFTLNLSFNGGFSSFPVVEGRTFTPRDADFGDYVWVVTDTISGPDPNDPLTILQQYTISNMVILQINDQYNKLSEAGIYNSPVFRILPRKIAIEKGNLALPGGASFSVFPNPSSLNGTLFAFSGISGQSVHLSVYNEAGQLVAALLPSAGNQKILWNGCAMTGQPVSAGRYFAKVSSNMGGTLFRAFSIVR